MPIIVMFLPRIKRGVIKMPRLLSLLLAILLASLHPLPAPALDDKVEELAPSQLHKRVTQLITYFISNYHYKRTKLDDALSAAVLDRYLETLDPNRSYFLLDD